MSKLNLLDAIAEVSKEKALDRELLTRLVEESIVAAAESRLPYNVIEGGINQRTGQIELLQYKEVVEFVQDARNEIELEEAQEVDPEVVLGDEVEYEISGFEFDRIARSARKAIFSSIKKAEREMILETFKPRIGEILTGTVLRTESNGRVAINFLDKAEAYLFPRDQIRGEQFSYGDHIRVLLLAVNNDKDKASQLKISRTASEFLTRLFEMEVPEIYDEIVKIKGASRDPGKRAKFAVYSTDDDVDPVGSCVGVRGSRVQNIINELQGEKIDIVRWSEDTATYACNALAPAEVERIEVNEDKKIIDAVVAQDQLAQAIGRKGQNVILASKLLGYTINVSGSEDSSRSVDVSESVTWGAPPEKAPATSEETSEGAEDSTTDAPAASEEANAASSVSEVSSEPSDN